MQPNKQYHAAHPQRLIINGDTSMYLRHANPDDSAEVYRIIRANRGHLSKDLQWAQNVDFIGFEKSVQDTLAQIKADKCLQYRIVAAGETIATQRIVGTVTLFNRRVLERTAVLSCWLAESDQGKGYATRAVKRLLQYAFDSWNIDTVTTLITEDNLRAQQLVKNLGASRTDAVVQREFGSQSVMLYRQWEFHA